jgi:putative transcriptional regulator
MGITVNIDVMMAKRKMHSGELAERIGITPANLSILKNNKARAIRFSTLEAICRELECQPGDILSWDSLPSEPVPPIRDRRGKGGLE